MTDRPKSSTFNAKSSAAYDHFMGRWSRKLATHFINFAGISDGDRVIDVGCGTGSLTEALAALPGIGSVIGVDLAAVYLDAAKQKIQDPRVSFKVGDATSLPVEDKQFDRAYAMLVLQFVPDAQAAIREMKRVVRDGGTVAATVWDSFGGMPSHRIFWDAAATLGFADAAKLHDFYFRPMTQPGQLAAGWAEAGLREIEHSTVRTRFEYRDFADYWQPIESGEGSPGRLLSGLSADERTALEAAAKNVFLGGALDGHRSFAATAWACKGIV